MNCHLHKGSTSVYIPCASCILIYYATAVVSLAAYTICLKSCVMLSTRRYSRGMTRASTPRSFAYPKSPKSISSTCIGSSIYIYIAVEYDSLLRLSSSYWGNALGPHEGCIHGSPGLFFWVCKGLT